MRYSATHMRIAFQGALGANGNRAAILMYPDDEYVPKKFFEDVFEAVDNGSVDRGIVYIENTVHGRIADVHRLLPESNLKIVKEYFLPVEHHLLVVPGATLEDIITVVSQAPALGQCRKIIKELGIKTREEYCTAGSAEMVAEVGDKSVAAIAPKLAAEMYGLEILKENIQDDPNNTTRCIVLAKEMEIPDQGVPALTTFIFQIKNIPAALYKVLGCFAKREINLTKLESYQLNGSFISTQFYVDLEGSIEDETLKEALSELENYATHIVVLGSYPRDISRRGVE